MSTKTIKLGAATADGDLPKNGKSANGAAPKSPKATKSMYEKWIEKYGVDESESAKAMLEIWRIAYESHNRPKA